MTERVRMLIDGVWTDAEDGAEFDATSPSTGGVVGTVARAPAATQAVRSRPRTRAAPAGRRAPRSTARPP